MLLVKLIKSLLQKFDFQNLNSLYNCIFLRLAGQSKDPDQFLHVLSNKRHYFLFCCYFNSSINLFNSFFIILLQDEPDIAPFIRPSKKFSLSSLHALDV